MDGSDSPAVANEFAGLSIDQGRAGSVEKMPGLPEGVMVVDITDKFFAAASTLQLGQVVKDAFFTLFESVSALEIMDPKMDSGAPGAEEILDGDYDLNRTLKPEEVIGIIDQLLCHEMAWHLGYPLSQTLFTSLYVEAMLMPQPNTIDEADFHRDGVDRAGKAPMQAILRAYCLGMLKGCYFVNERIQREHFYEEEDFVTNTYNRTLLAQIDTGDILDALQEARQLVHSMSFSLSKDVSQALDFRLELRSAFLRAIELSEYRTQPASMKTPWIHMKALLDPVYESHKLGRPVPESFSAKLQSRLASTMPPRPVVQLSFEDACGHFRRFLEDGIEVINVLKYSDPQSLMMFVLSFQAKKPQPLVFIRTLLQSYLFKDMILLGTLSVRQVLDEDLATIVLPGSILLDRANDETEAVHDPRYAIAHQMELFRQRAAQSYLDIFRTFCQNRSRVRRTLCHTVQDWEVLQTEAEDMDQLLQVQIEEIPVMRNISGRGQVPTYSLPLSSWSYLYKLKQMEWILQLGFELNVYQPDELAGMYWYLNHLAKSRVEHVDRIKSFNSFKLGLFRNSPQVNRASKEAEYSRSQSYLHLATLDADVTWELADALYCLYTALDRLGLAKAPHRPYSSAKLRYELRMKPFLPVAPEMPGFQEFMDECVDNPMAPLDLLKCAETAVAGARKGFEAMRHLDDARAFCVGSHGRWAELIKTCVKTCIATAISISKVKAALVDRAGESGELRIRVEVPLPQDCYHDWWIVPKVVPV